ncbi:hypothetical protein BDP27DRAFT_1309581 [Rhodocollybia butyracea]|uniref:Condensin complex subunit 1 n=1 Tax=Rhodocollybia butyracea TaxID=206335 RepID=A0A9P5UGI9_9AGAR|nr:hypothetical protein BDP27DRAFT_1309581 [Rhodocollybia butyracea]
MSSNSSPPGPRRSHRDKKPVKIFTIETESSTTNRKRKHAGTDDEGPVVLNGGDAVDDDDDPEQDEPNADGSDGEDGPPKKSRKKTKGQPAAKKARTAAPSTRKLKKPRVPKDPATTKSKKRATEAPNAPFDPAALTQATHISSDNPLFNAIVNPNAALQGTVEDFLESLGQDENQALAELVNMILRCCACNGTIDSDAAVDYDGVADVLDDLSEDLKKTTSPAGTYPLISKNLPFHNSKTKYSFRANLCEFISRLISASALLGPLYDSPLVDTLEVWLVPMSSSQIRSIRHTSTVIALEVETALSRVAKDVEKEVEVAGRMKEGEKKRARSKGATGSVKGKDKEIDAKLRDSKAKQKKLAEFIKEFIDGVFVHRIRDLEPVIRTEYPASSVRLAAIKALQVVYEGSGAGNGAKNKGRGDVAILPSVRHFTARFLPRLLQIARFDVDIGVRVALMTVLGCIDELALLPEDERDKLGTLVFSDEPRIRKAVGRFVSSAWDEWVEEKMGEVEVLPARGNATNGRGRGRGKGGAAAAKVTTNVIDQDKVGIKGLAHMLVRWGRVLDRERKPDENNEEEETEDGNEGQNGSSGDTDVVVVREIAAVLVTPSGNPGEVGRIGIAVEALWDDMDVVRDWEGILDMLVLDHSASGENNSSNKVRRSQASKNKSAAKKVSRRTSARADNQEDDDEDDDDGDDDNASTSTRVDQSWRLTEVEEGVLLEVLVASLQRTRRDDRDDSTGEPITQALIKALPRLFIKYQTDEIRIVAVLTLPTLMNLEVYLEMRETTAYISLWSDISKQFLTHTSSYVIATAAKTIVSHLLTNTAYELVRSLRDAVAGPVPLPSSPSRSTEDHFPRDIEICHLTEDEVLTLTAVVLRLTSLARHRDISSLIEENEGESIAVRRRVFSNPDRNTSPEEVKDRENLISQQDALLEKLIEYAVGTQVQGNGIVEGVKRAAFKILLNLHIMFSSSPSDPEEDFPSATLKMDDEVQWRCAGFIQAEVLRYSDAYTRTVNIGSGDEDSETENEDSEREGAEGQPKKTKASKKKISKEDDAEVDFSSRPILELEYVFIDVITTFLRALHAGVIQVRHGAILLAHYGMLGPAFDACVKMVVDMLKDEGLSNDNGQLIVLVATQTMKEAFNIFKKSPSHDETHLLALAKLISSCFLIRGSQLAVLRRLDAQHVLDNQANGIRSSSGDPPHKVAIVFFQALVPLVATVQSRDALKIKAHLDQAWVQAKIEPGTTKMWEPLRAYEKRLSAAMGKDKPSAPKARGKRRKKTGRLSSDGEESEVEKLVGDDNEPLSDAPPDPPQPRPRPRPRRAAANKSRETPSGGSNSESELEPFTPKSRPHPSAVYKSKAMASPTRAAEPNGVGTPVDIGKRPREDDEEDDRGQPEQDTPRPSRKRPRRDEDSDADAESADYEEAEAQASLPNGNQTDPAEAREPTPGADVQIRRKRIRH